eukprot:GDKJ01022143.1.p1 GENE.GDKJ01022143.1~~GDKJ01022143.1.p1  ORF type:complete len:271 (-),score=67.05 GDKJ01022143.1:68-880(-)
MMIFFRVLVLVLVLVSAFCNQNAVGDYMSAQNIRKITTSRRIKEMARQMEKLKADALLDSSNGGSTITKEEVDDVAEMMKSIQRLQLEMRAIDQNIKQVMSGKQSPPFSRSQRIAALNLLAFPDEVRSARNGFGQLKGDILSIFSNGRILKKLYYVSAIDLPIENMAGTNKCFTFKYGSMRHSLCGADEKSRNAWMNAISETWFCFNYRICGKMSDADAAAQVLDKQDEDKKDEDEDEPEEDVDMYKIEVIGNKGVLTKAGRVVDAARVE